MYASKSFIFIVRFCKHSFEGYKIRANKIDFPFRSDYFGCVIYVIQNAHSHRLFRAMVLRARMCPRINISVSLISCLRLLYLADNVLGRDIRCLLKLANKILFQIWHVAVLKK